MRRENRTSKKIFYPKDFSAVAVAQQCTWGPCSKNRGFGGTAVYVSYCSEFSSNLNLNRPMFVLSITFRSVFVSEWTIYSPTRHMHVIDEYVAIFQLMILVLNDNEILLGNNKKKTNEPTSIVTFYFILQSSVITLISIYVISFLLVFCFFFYGVLIYCRFVT